MTIQGALNEHDAKVVCGDRWLVGGTDGEESFFIVYEKTSRQRYARALVESSNEDECCRYLLGEKD